MRVDRSYVDPWGKETPFNWSSKRCFVFSAAGPVYVAGNLGLLPYHLGLPGQPPALSGIDVGLVRDGQIAQLYTTLTAENRPSSTEE
jgi:hypothetical protein